MELCGIMKLISFLLVFALFSCSGNKENIEVNNKQDLMNVVSKNRLSVFTFLSPECPLSENYTSVLNNLNKKHELDSVVFYSVFPGKFYSKKQIEAFIVKYGLISVVIYDESYFLTKFLQAEITPETFLITKNGAVIYSGAIDDWAVSLGKQRAVVENKYLEYAIFNNLNGIQINPNKTKAVGCIIE